jgi:hypothetical protein
MPEPGFVKVISVASGAIAEVPQSSLFQHYQAGWRLLAEGDVPPQVAPEEPAPMSEADVKAALAKSKPSSSKERSADG